MTLAAPPRVVAAIVTAIPAEDLAGFDVRCILTKPVVSADLVTAVRRCLTSAAP
jgi:hypothetical protein